MATISDSDSSSSVDAVVVNEPFPFWLSVVEVTADSVLASDGTPLSGAIILTPSETLDLDGVLVEGSATITVSGGTADAPVTIPCTDCVSPSFTYTVYLRLNTPDGISPAPVTGVLVPSTLHPSVDISQLLEGAQLGDIVLDQASGQVEDEARQDIFDQRGS